MKRRKSFKSFMSVLLVLALFLQLNALLAQVAFAVTPHSTNPPATAPGQWLHGSGSNIEKWWYKHNDNTYTTNDWEYINGDWYHFDSSGWMDTGWYRDDSSSPYYYLGSDGKMRTGWKQLGSNGNYYYFDKTNAYYGQMKTGWQQLGNNGNWYYFASNGVMATGWKQLGNNGHWYHFGDNGVMSTYWEQIDNDWYYFGDNGVMRTGWQKINSYWYYLGGANSGKMRTGFQTIGNHWYIFETNGHLRNINSGYLPLLDYPAVLDQDPTCWFSNSGSACYHHNPGQGVCHDSGSCGCKSFSEAIQCLGFAMYAFNEYSNMGMSSSEFRTYYETMRDNQAFDDNVKRDEPINSAEDLKSVLFNLPRGTYVNLSNSNNKKEHTFILYSTDTDGITVYDANMDGHCGVKLWYVSYETLKGLYNNIFLILTHHYSNSAAAGNRYCHYFPCTTPGCTAKKYIPHNTLGANSSCTKCGYTPNTIQSVEPIEQEAVVETTNEVLTEAVTDEIIGNDIDENSITDLTNDVLTDYESTAVNNDETTEYDLTETENDLTTSEIPETEIESTLINEEQLF